MEPTLRVVTKADGETEAFDVSKLETSLKHAGASPKIRADIIETVRHSLPNGSTTEAIYKRAFELLRREEDKPVAARYSVKRAVFALGPSGFPLEQFLAEVLKAHGWKTRTGLAMTGKCVPHEVDVLATKDGVRAGIEVKFHNSAGIKTDVKDALYVHARFEDLKQAPRKEDVVDEGWLVTNTRFTRNAIRYGRCSGLKLVGWDYPNGGGLVTMIESAGVHPVTALTTLSDGEKRSLLERNMVLCRGISKSGHVLREHGVQESRIPQILEEAKRLCYPA